MHTSFDRPFTNRRYLEAVADHVVVFDGATGTELAKTGLLPEDFGSESAMGLMEMLVLYRPDVVTAAHTAYLEAGADVIETDTFRGNRITLQEFGVADFVLEINTGAAALARRVADRFATQTGQPRFVAGAIGPTGQLPSLAAPHAATMFDQLVDVFAEQASGLLAGGVDLLLLETQQDLLALKAAILGIWTAFTDAGVRIPIQAQVTLDPSGRMLTGPNIEAAVATLAALPVDVIGLNCSTGPEEMRDSVRKLLAMTNRPVSVLPNAGMPENVGGRALYRLAPEVFARTMAEFVRWGVRIVGGCCGTGPEHIQALRACISNQESPVAFPVVDYPRALPWLTSSVQAVALHQEPRPLLVGERINTQGSRKARQLVLEERYEALLDLAETQTESGAHVLDVCLALTERDDEEVALRHVVRLLSQNASAPLMIDTTSLEAMRAVLQVSPGRLIINSVNLEAGEAHAREVLDLARTFGAALVALTIDEQGMAKSCQRKLDIARRLYRLAVEDTGLPPHALIFDPLTFTLATGDAASANAAMETLNALRAIKTELPGVLTNLGVSNVSYGLHPAARRVLNSVFLYRAVEAGLDLAIVNPAQIVPFPEIPPDLRALADDVIFNRSSEALARFLAYFEAGSFPESEARQLPERAPAEQLFDAILYRRREGVEAIVDACLSEQAPLSILNKVLLPAMKEVGERFGRGELILPFVLRSAEVMQAAVAHLEPHLERSEGMSRGTVVLATVYGDVHDIGKNLVKTILVNNGYTVHDLGKQVPVGTVIDQALALHADAIGLSALLVATSRQMQIAVAELHRRSLRIPVLVGGAAINPSFARRIAVTTGGDLYPGGVFYCKDAFEALQVLEHIVMYQPQVSEAH
ncbi:MAG: homocysteine S-methyltransferase family protein, partial [Anaerolineae bacterium]|nr:homocysteine S-methyltransferase family protein [Anaerolineae bacterium]